MNSRRFVIELAGGPASERRTLEALELAAALAAFEHDVQLVLHAPVVARFSTARDEPELDARLGAVANAGVDRAITTAPGAPPSVGALGLTTSDPAAARAKADAVLVF